MDKPVPLARDPRDGQVEHAELHAARDVDADGVGHHGALGGEHATDREPVAEMRIGHERAGDRDGKLRSHRHLRERLGLDVAAPPAPGHRFGTQRGRRATATRGTRHKASRHLPKRLVLFERGRVADDRLDAGAQVVARHPLGAQGTQGRRGQPREIARQSEVFQFPRLHGVSPSEEIASQGRRV
jgi:hypothetical protein